MVELNVDLKNVEALDNDCFIAVRVGEAQKMSKLVSTRSYKFPQAAGRGHGRIEIYRRVGSCGIDVDPQNEGTRSVNIGCGSFGKMQFDVQVGATGATQAPSPEKADPPQAEKGKSKTAKDYLRKHSVEMQLTEAMQALLRERPANPVRFLAEKLLSNLEDGAVGVAPAGAKAAPAVEKPSPVPPIEKAAPKEAPREAAPLRNFSEYYAQYFKLAPESSLSSLLASFPVAKKVETPTPPKTSAPPPASKEAPRQAAPLAPFSEYYDKYFQTAPESSFNSLHAQFVTKQAQPTPAPTAAATTTSTAPAQAFPFKPSVGTWLAPVPLRKEAPQPAASQPALAAPKVNDGEAVPFNAKPSVGTWLGRPLPKESAAAKAQAAAEYPLPQKRKRCLAVSTGTFGPSFNTLRLQPRMMCI